MRLIPMSESELAWDLFYESGAGAIRQYRQWLDSKAGVSIIQLWCRLDVTWEHGRQGEAVVRLARRLPRAGLDTLRHDRIRFYGTIGPSAILRLTVNGRAHDLRGGGEPAQYTVPIGGWRIRSLSFEFIAVAGGPGAASLIWLALVDSRRDRGRLAQKGRYDETWEGYLLPAKERIQRWVEIGLLFGQENLGDLRRKVRSALYRPWMDHVRANARTMLRARPESLIGRFACPHLHYTRPPERAGLAATGGYSKSWDSFHHLAFAGLMDEDQRLLRHAARWMLSLASCEYWYNDFAGELPGTVWHHRAFAEARVTTEVSLALDWAGSALTDEGRRLVRDAIARRGMPRIQQDFVDPACEYIRSMNQGIVFNTGRILGLIALAKEWPRAADRLAEAEADAREMFEKTFTRDGGSVEGPAYWRYTMDTGLLGMIALARYRGCTVAELLPPKMKTAPSYLPVFASTAPEGSYLPIGDAHAGPICQGSLAAMLVRAFPCEESDRLATHALRDTTSGSDPALAVIFGPERLGKRSSLVPEFAVRRETGHCVVCRRMAGVGPVRLQLYGAPGVGGSHSHDDRGNILLEAGGEPVLIDRGIGHYSNPMQTAKRPEAHSLLVPDMPDGSVPRQNTGHSQDICPRASYQGGRFRARIETTGAWPSHVRLCRRTVVSPMPGVFEITDELELSAPLAATFHLHTPLAAHRQDRAWVLAGQQVQVRVEPRWRVVAAEFAKTDMDMGRHGHVYGHLQLRSGASRKHRLVTALRVERR